MMKSKNLFSSLALAAVLLVFAAGSAEAQKKKGPTLQDPYNFDYSITDLGSCCFEITVVAPDSGNAHHQFQVDMNGTTYVDFSEDFTYGNQGSGNNIVSWVYCLDPAYPNDRLTFDIEVICSDHGSADIYSETRDIQCDYDLMEGCCVKYYLDCAPPAGTTVTYGIMDENGVFIQQAVDIDYDNLLTDPHSGRKYVVVCPGVDRTTVELKIVVTYPDGSQCAPCSIEKTITTTCCNCGDGLAVTHPINTSPFTLARADLEDPTCQGCAYKLEFTNRLGLPEWADCYDDVTIELYSNTDGQTEKKETYSLSSFTTDDFGIFCLDEGEEMKFNITFNKNNPPEDEHGSSSCWQYFKFNCDGIVYDTTDTLIHPIPDSEPCDPDCPQVAWTDAPTDHGTFTTTTGRTVNVTFKYVFRDACDYQDIQVTDIIYQFMWPALTAAEKREIFAQIIAQIVEKNVMNFHPNKSDADLMYPEPACDSTWRVTMGSCWAFVPYCLPTFPLLTDPDPQFRDFVILDSEAPAQDYSDPLISAHLQQFPLQSNLCFWYEKKCADVDCCTQLMRVCKVKDDGAPGGYSTYYQNVASPDNYFTCENVFTWYTDYQKQECRVAQCYDKCDWLTELMDWLILPGQLKIQFLDDSSNLIKYGINDYHADNQIKVSFDTQEDIIVEVLVYDVTGNQIETAESSYSAGQSQLTINTSTYKSGAYFYTIVVNGVPIKSNKFAVIK